ncbi:hypothetical protein [Actinomadura alba]|nr:hypothetical protein [Actinomadura alba]
MKWGIHYTSDDIVDNSPIMKDHVDTGMTVAALGLGLGLGRIR